MTTRPRRKAKSARVWVRVALTRAEVQRLRSLAAADFRSVGSFVTWLMAHDLARSPNPRPRQIRRASASDSRISYSVLLTMPQVMRSRLEAAARAELRSVSGYVGRVIVETLARRLGG
jgi:hypothetical protein